MTQFPFKISMMQISFYYSQCLHSNTHESDFAPLKHIILIPNQTYLLLLFWPRCCLPFSDLQIMIATLYLEAYSLMLRINKYQFYSLWIGPTGVRTPGENAIQYTTYAVRRVHLRFKRNLFSVHEEVIPIRLYTPCSSGLHKDVYNLIQVTLYFEWIEHIISINPYKLIRTFVVMILKNIFIFQNKANNRN